MGIRFRAAGGFALLGIPMAELAGAVVELDDLLGRGPVRVQERLQEAPSVEARFEILEQFVLDRVRRAKAPSAPVAAAVETIGRTQGTARMADLRRDLGVSDTRLVQAFKKEIGLAPKRFARVVRLQAVLERLQAEDGVPWAALAQDFGFFDQAHFVRDFRELTGASPTEFLRTRAPDGQAIVVDGA
jgi:AraC-like DNA-binding protein